MRAVKSILTVSFLLGACVRSVNGPDEIDSLPIVGLPDPLVTSQAGNIYVVYEGLGWADGGAAVAYWVHSYDSHQLNIYTLRRIDDQSKATVSSELLARRPDSIEPLHPEKNRPTPRRASC